MNRARLGALLGVFAGVLLCLSACSTDYSRSYNRALDTFASGEYAEAAEAFERPGRLRAGARLRRLFPRAGAL